MACLLAKPTVPTQFTISGLMRPIANITLSRLITIPYFHAVTIKVEIARYTSGQMHTNNAGTHGHPVVKVRPHLKTDVKDLTVVTQSVLEQILGGLHRIAESRCLCMIQNLTINTTNRDRSLLAIRSLHFRSRKSNNSHKLIFRAKFVIKSSSNIITNERLREILKTKKPQFANNFYSKSLC